MHERHTKWTRCAALRFFFRYFFRFSDTSTPIARTESVVTRVHPFFPSGNPPRGYGRVYVGFDASTTADYFFLSDYRLMRIVLSGIQHTHGGTK